MSGLDERRARFRAMEKLGPDEAMAMVVAVFGFEKTVEALARHVAGWAGDPIMPPPPQGTSEAAGLVGVLERCLPSARALDAIDEEVERGLKRSW